VQFSFVSKSNWFCIKWIKKCCPLPTFHNHKTVKVICLHTCSCNYSNSTLNWFTVLFVPLWLARVIAWWHTTEKCSIKGVLSKGGSLLKTVGLHQRPNETVFISTWSMKRRSNHCSELHVVKLTVWVLALPTCITVISGMTIFNLLSQRVIACMYACNVMSCHIHLLATAVNLPLWASGW